MKKVSLSAKIIGLVVTAVFTVGACLFASTYYFVDKGFQDQTQQEIARQADAVQIHFDNITARMAAAAKLTASRRILAEAIEKGDTAYVQKLGKEVMRDSQAGFITIADKNGNVVGRGHSDKTGDSVLSQPNVKKALAGEASTGIEEGTVVKFSLRAGAPVKVGDKVVGSVTTGVDLTPADHAIVEEVKKLFGIECTFFQGDTRVTTTLMKDGQRVVGTKMDNPKVLDTVLAKGQRFLAVNKILGKDYTTAYWPLKDASGKVIGMVFIGQDREIALAAVRNTEWSILAILAIIGTLMVFAGILVARSITRPINRAITILSEAAEQVVSASGQVSSASQSLAEGASEQAASIEETSSSLEEMSSMTKQNADNASTADNLMKESKQMVERANGSMTELTQSMEDISKASDETSKIIKTIDEIAFQTNLLALNAAVEAARAGEAGAGFAVVANEVRNLAMRAAEAAKNTSVLIEGTVKKVKEGSELVERTGVAFAEVSKSATKVAGLVAEIAAASSEQAQGIDQINKAVTEMDKVTQQTAANAEESASASEEMNAQAEQMKEVAGEIIRIVGSGGSKDAGKGRGEPAKKDEADWKAPLMARLKAPREKSPGAAGSRKPSRPEEVIPFGKDNFKDF
jgi:sensor histidine kinase regulating citrate/malate metabolism